MTTNTQKQLAKIIKDSYQSSLRIAREYGDGIPKAYDVAMQLIMVLEDKIAKGEMSITMHRKAI